jgi:hypothetical protein
MQGSSFGAREAIGMKSVVGSLPISLRRICVGAVAKARRSAGQEAGAQV